MRLNDKNTQQTVFKLTPEGYLVKRCHIARTGPMEYAGEEIDRDKGKAYQVETTADDLFSPETIASYEGMPVSLLHPSGLVVDSKNWKDVAIGHLSNVAMNPDGIHLDGTVTINDANAIEVSEKHDIKELSCGQDADVEEGADGKLYKKNIRGNHVAVVPSARAGIKHRLGDKGMTMTIKKSKKNLVDSLKKVLGITKKLNDEEPLSSSEKDELEAAIAELQAVLDALPPEALPEEVDALKAQIAELQAKLDAMADSKKKVDADTENTDDAALQDQIASLMAENEALKKENEALKAQKDKESSVADASARFPGVKLGDAKNARGIHMLVLADKKVFSDAQMQGMSDVEIRAAYAGLVASASQAKSNVGKKLLGDSKSKKVDLTKKFGGKKNAK